MNENARRLRILAGGAAVGFAGVITLAGPAASADPLAPQPAVPAPATVTQIVTVTPNAAPLASGQLAGVTGATPAAAAASVPIPGAGVPAAAAPGVPVGDPAPAPPAQPVVVPLSPDPAGTLADFFKDKGVRMEPQSAKDFTALHIVLPMPSGWAQVPDPNVPDAFAVIADRVGGDGLYTSNAQVLVYKLVGDFDPREAIRHGFVDSQQLTAWRPTDGRISVINGVPTSAIEGTYRENNMTLNTSRHHLIATSGPDRYLISLAVTTGASVSVASGDATDAIINGFKVIPPDAAPGAPVAAPAPAAAPLVPQIQPPVPALPQATGLPN